MAGCGWPRKSSDMEARRLAVTDPLRDAHTERHVTVAEAATRLTVSAKTIRKYIDAGILKAVRLPYGQFRIPESQVARLLKQASP